MLPRLAVPGSAMTTAKENVKWVDVRFHRTCCLCLWTQSTPLTLGAHHQAVTNDFSVGPPRYSICAGSRYASCSRIRWRSIQTYLERSISKPPTRRSGHPTIPSVSYYSGFRAGQDWRVNIRAGNRLCLRLEAHQTVSSGTDGCGILRNCKECFPTHTKAFLTDYHCNCYNVVTMPVWSFPSCESIGGLVD